MANVSIALLADYVNTSMEGKLNILGVFDIVYAHNFPAIHPQMQLVIRFEADRAEAKTTKKIEVQLIDEDGKKLISVGGELNFGECPEGEIFIIQNQVITFNSLMFPSPGTYEFKILVNEEVRKSVPLRVIKKST